jgi:Glycolipid transfer protein (GLTP)
VQKGSVTTKNSLSRNVHRLRTVIVFTEMIMAHLICSATTSLSGAVSAAYGETLAPYHSAIVRATCNAGFLLLPSRHAFLQSIGESGAISTQSASCDPSLAHQVYVLISNCFIKAMLSLSAMCCTLFAYM